MKLPRERFEYSAMVERRPVGLPAGARIAVWTIVNVEEWNIEAPMPRPRRPEDKPAPNRATAQDE